MCGNKCDLRDERQVSYSDAANFCQENNVLYLETSAMNGENIEKAFMEVTK